MNQSKQWKTLSTIKTIFFTACIHFWGSHNEEKHLIETNHWVHGMSLKCCTNNLKRINNQKILTNTDREVYSNYLYHNCLCTVALYIIWTISIIDSNWGTVRVNISCKTNYNFWGFFFVSENFSNIVHEMTFVEFFEKLWFLYKYTRQKLEMTEQLYHISLSVYNLFDFPCSHIMIIIQWNLSKQNTV